VDIVAADRLLGTRSASGADACEGGTIEADHASDSTSGAEQASQSAQNWIGSSLDEVIISGGPRIASSRVLRRTDWVVWQQVSPPVLHGPLRPLVGTCSERDM